MNFPDRLAADAAFCEARLLVALEGRADQPVTQAMRYAVKGGKRLRGFLVLEGARMLGVAEGRALSAAAAVEALHAYSLVHDDLP
ncbi:MAG: polyprenyl synthetase family protein, partial [Tabrizicola sp.]